MALPEPYFLPIQLTALQAIQQPAVNQGVVPTFLGVGDSRVAQWNKPEFATFGAVAFNYGIGGTPVEDHTWIIQNSPLDLSQVTGVLIISGFNNLRRQQTDPQDISVGIYKLTKAIHTRCPLAKIVVVEIFPATPPTTWTDPAWPEYYTEARRREVNTRVRGMVDTRGGYTTVSTGLTDPADTTCYQADRIHLTPAAYTNVLTPMVQAAFAAT